MISCHESTRYTWISCRYLRDVIGHCADTCGDVLLRDVISHGVDAHGVGGVLLSDVAALNACPARD